MIASLPQTVTAQDDIVQVSRQGAVAIVTMNYPERRNAFSLKLRLALISTFQHLMHDDQESRAIVLCGAGGHFCSGGDLSEMTTVSPSLAQMRERIAIGTRLLKLIFCGNKPVVAAIEGYCMGAGISLAAACDLAVGSAAAKYSCAFVKVGLMPDTGILWTLPQKVGGGKARELMLSGAGFDGVEAGKIGLVNQVVEPGQALAAALAQAEKLAGYPPVTLALLKGSLVNGVRSIEDACRLETDLNPLTRQTEDHQEAVNAFMQKRRPVFTGN